MLTCREVAERANDYVDGNLPLWQALKLRVHIYACGACYGFVRQMKAVKELVKSYGEMPPERDTEDLLIHAFGERRRLDSAGGVGARDD